MSKWNEVYFQGNAGKDATTKELSNGKRLTNFTLAVWQGRELPSIWLQIKAFDVGEAEIVRKGDKVGVKGRLFFELWTDKEGKERQQFGVMTESVELLKTAEQMEAF